MTFRPQQASLTTLWEQIPPGADPDQERRSAPPYPGPFPELVIAFKFGGSSLLGAGRLLHAAELVRRRAVDSRVCVVVSAMKGVTDRLLSIAQRLRAGDRERARRDAEAVSSEHFATLVELGLDPEEERRVRHELRLLRRDLLYDIPLDVHVEVDAAFLDRLASYGERFSARLFAAALGKLGVVAVPVASLDFVLTCDTFCAAEPLLGPTRHRGRAVLEPLLDAGIVPVVTGFIGATEDGRITTLGRNSSDFSGALVAHVVEADELVIWTDVDGMYTANPHESDQARLLDELSYEDAHRLAAGGAKVLHPRVLRLAALTQMVVWIRNTFKPYSRGTRIGPSPQGGDA